MAETQASHRQDLERTVINGNVQAEKRGQWFGLIIALTFGIGGFWLIAQDKGAMGLSVVIADITALVAVFVIGRRKQEQERARKREEFERLPAGRPFARGGLGSASSASSAAA